MAKGALRVDILILGGTRFFGRRLAVELSQRGHQVTVASRGLTPDGFLPDRISRLVLDRTDPHSLATALHGRRYDLVYDQLCFTPQDARNLLDVLEDRAARYVITSSGGVYPGKEGVLTEEDFLPSAYPVDLSASSYTYEEGKRQAEAYWFQHAPVPVVAARVSFVLSGTDDYTGRFAFQVNHVAQGISLGDYAKEHDASYVTAADAARFLSFIGTETAYQGPVNCVNRGALSARGLARAIGRHLGKAPRFHIAEPSDPDFSPYALEATRRVSSDLAQTLGFSFGPLEEALPRMIDDVLQGAT